MSKSYSKQKAFGQNFLKDKKIIHSILDIVDLQMKKNSTKRWVEVGPGKGALTLPFLERNPSSQLILIEKDRDLVQEWNERSISGLKVIDQDALETDFNKIYEGETFGFFSNLPYSVGTGIFTKLALYPHRIQFMVLMFQKEVAERIRAMPSTKARGSLSVWSQNAWNIEKALIVPPHAFTPAPKVDSEVILCTPRETPMVPESQQSPHTQELWQELLKTAFSHRRKMLRAIFSKNKIWTQALQESGIPPTLRAEALGWPEWRALFVSLLKLKPMSEK